MKLFLIKSNKGKNEVAERVLCFKKKTRLTVMKNAFKVVKQS